MAISVEPRIAGRLQRIDDRVIELLRRYSTTLLRVAVGIVFIWFGALKVTGDTPVAELVGNTVYWFDRDWVVPVLGATEIAIGFGLIFGRALRLVLAVFLAQMVGTFLVLIVQPDVAFEGGNPFLLTVEGEFVVKNLVLITAGLVVGATVHHRSFRTLVE